MKRAEALEQLFEAVAAFLAVPVKEATEFANLEPLVQAFEAVEDSE